MPSALTDLDSLRPVLQPALDTLEAERVRIMASLRNAGFISLCVFLVGSIIAVIIAAIFRISASAFLFGLPALIGGGIFAWTYSSCAKEYRNGFKMLVIPHIVNSVATALNGQLNYQPDSGVNESEFNACGFFSDPDRYQCEDLIQGRIGETQLRFSEVHAEREERTRDSRGNTSRRYVTIFKGLFFIADFNKDFRGTTLVTPDMTERFLGRFGQKLQEFGAKFSFSSRELVKLEDPEFEKVFAVYSGDQIEARYLLSTSLMRRLLDFRAKCKSDFHLAFMANHIYLAIPLNSNWFEPPAFTQPLTFDVLSQYTTQLHFALGIIEDLDLNTRIWSKS
jgi:hypothetical protein